MSTPSRQPHEEHGSPESETSSLILLATLADTTWRMFIPPAFFVFGGIIADRHWHTGPWLSLLAAAVGLGVSVLLIRMQLKKIKD